MKNVAIVFSSDSDVGENIISIPEGCVVENGDLVMAKVAGKDIVCECLTSNFAASEETVVALRKYFKRDDCAEPKALGRVEQSVAPFRKLEKKHVGRVIRDKRGEHYGFVGHPAGFKDKLGIDLFVGDVVHLFDCEGAYRGKKFIVKPDAHKRCFVMGVAGAGPTKKIGELEHGWTIHRFKSFEKVTGNEEFDNLRVVPE